MSGFGRASRRIYGLLGVLLVVVGLGLIAVPALAYFTGPYRHVGLHGSIGPGSTFIFTGFCRYFNISSNTFPALHFAINVSFTTSNSAKVVVAVYKVPAEPVFFTPESLLSWPETQHLKPLYTQSDETSLDSSPLLQLLFMNTTKQTVLGEATLKPIGAHYFHNSYLDYLGVTSLGNLTINSSQVAMGDYIIGDYIRYGGAWALLDLLVYPPADGALIKLLYPQLNLSSVFLDILVLYFVDSNTTPQQSFTGWLLAGLETTLPENLILIAVGTILLTLSFALRPKGGADVLRAQQGSTVTPQRVGGRDTTRYALPA